MENYKSLMVRFCPNCGQEVPEKEYLPTHRFIDQDTARLVEEKDYYCSNCGNWVIFSIEQFNELEKKYCAECGVKSEEGTDACDACGAEQKTSFGRFHYSIAEDLYEAEKYIDAIEEAKKALPFANAAEEKFQIYYLITFSHSKHLGQVYGDLNYWPQEFIKSQESKDHLFYVQQELATFDSCPTAIKQEILSTGEFKPDELRGIVKDLSQEIEKSQRSSAKHEGTKKDEGTKSIVIGESTMQDVFDKFGPGKWRTTDTSKTWWAEYDDFQYHVEVDNSLPRYPLNEEVHLQKPIVKIVPAKSGSCFIATAVYGSACGPEIQFLRHFRDDFLSSSYTGKILIAFYYYISPPIARIIARSQLLKKLVETYLLKPLIKFLKTQI